MPDPIVGPGRDHGAAVICSGASAQTAVDWCGFYMDLHPGNIGFGAAKPEEAPAVWFKCVLSN